MRCRKRASATSRSDSRPWSNSGGAPANACPRASARSRPPPIRRCGPAARVALDAAAATQVDLGQVPRVHRAAGRTRSACASRCRPCSATRPAAPRYGWMVPGGHALRAPVTLGPFGATACRCCPACRQRLDRRRRWPLLREGQVVAPVDRDNRRSAPRPGADMRHFNVSEWALANRSLVVYIDAGAGGARRVVVRPARPVRGSAVHLRAMVVRTLCRGHRAGGFDR